MQPTKTLSYGTAKPALMGAGTEKNIIETDEWWMYSFGKHPLFLCWFISS
jgi:hypothetical protein